MKKQFDVLVQETFSKYVRVYVEDESQIDNEIAAMEESGEIQMGSEEFDNWEIMATEEVLYTDGEINRVKIWCSDMVRVTSIVDPDWVEEEMDESQCQDWFEQIRYRGVEVPKEVTSSDLWEAVNAYRRKAGE